jgi:hypothetical protein
MLLFEAFKSVKSNTANFGQRAAWTQRRTGFWHAVDAHGCTGSPETVWKWIFAGLTLCAKQPSFPFIRGANRSVAAVCDRRWQAKAERATRERRRPRNLIQVMLA